MQAKKAELEASKKQLGELKAKIASLEKEISEVDSSFTNNRNAVLVATLTLEKKPFDHFIEVRGSVESRRNVFLSAQLGGEIEAVHVREGQRVTKNQTLVSLNADVLRSSLSELKNSHELAITIFDKQSKLWEQKIGTEVQYLQAKNNMESLEKKIAATNAQLSQLVIRAPFSGTIDKVEALVGEMASPGIPIVRMINSDDVYIKADVPENLIGRFKTGDKASVHFPSQNKTIGSAVTSVGQVINPENRTFELDVKLPAGSGVKPNQIAIVTLRDYVNEKAFSVPTKVIQRDNQGEFIYILEDRQGISVAHRVYVRAGISYSGNTEIVDGLTGTEIVIGEGFRDVTEGTEIRLANAVKEITEVANQ